MSVTIRKSDVRSLNFVEIFIITMYLRLIILQVSSGTMSILSLVGESGKIVVEFPKPDQ